MTRVACPTEAVIYHGGHATLIPNQYALLTRPGLVGHDGLIFPIFLIYLCAFYGHRQRQAYIMDKQNVFLRDKADDPER